MKASPKHIDEEANFGQTSQNASENSHSLFIYELFQISLVKPYKAILEHEEAIYEPFHPNATADYKVLA